MFTYCLGLERRNCYSRQNEAKLNSWVIVMALSQPLSNVWRFH